MRIEIVVAESELEMASPDTPLIQEGRTEITYMPGIIKERLFTPGPTPLLMETLRCSSSGNGQGRNHAVPDRSSFP